MPSARTIKAWEQVGSVRSRSSRGVSTLLTVCIGVWLALLGVEWHQYRSDSAALTAQVGRRAMKIAQMVVLVLEPQREAYLALDPDDPATRHDPNYFKLQERLRSVQAQFNDVRYVYTEKIFAQQGYLVYLLDATPPDRDDFSPIGERDTDIQDKAYRDGNRGFDRALHRYERWGALLTGWAPIRDLRGEVHSYAAVDIDANQLQRELTKVRQSTIISVFGTTLLMGLFTLIGSRLLRDRFVHLDATTRSAEHFRHLAMHDGLTSLPNRRLATERLAQLLTEAGSNAQSVAAVYLDIDGFKDVNDRYGHAYGDQVLIAATRRLSACVRETDLVARLAGDEFLVVLPDVENSEQAVRIAKAILDALARSITISGNSITISASIGIACFPEHASTVDALLHMADQAMYRAKQAGKNCYNLAATAAAG
jgi:diguanylate cyclase (GGDEF)-like protein